MYCQSRSENRTFGLFLRTVLVAEDVLEAFVDEDLLRVPLWFSEPGVGAQTGKPGV